MEEAANSILHIQIHHTLEKYQDLCFLSLFLLIHYQILGK